MRWEDENYVKLYTRDTPTWRAWRWEARALLPLLMRAVDKAGLLECGELGRKAVALMVAVPEEVAAAGLADLERTGTIVWHGAVLEISKFEEAQEARKSDILRKREERQKAKDRARAEALKNTQPLSHDVTRGHEMSQPVTLQTPQTPQTPQFVGDEKAPTPKRKENQPPDPRHVPLRESLRGIYEKALGEPWAFDGSDAKALSALLKQYEPPEIEARWLKGIADQFRKVRRVRELAAKWGHFGTAPPTQAGGARTDFRKGMVRADDVPKEAFAKTGTLNDF